MRRLPIAEGSTRSAFPASRLSAPIDRSGSLCRNAKPRAPPGHHAILKTAQRQARRVLGGVEKISQHESAESVIHLLDG